MAHDTTKQIMTFRAAPDLAAQVRAMAEREHESDSVILRRLLRLGLAEARRTTAALETR